MMIKYRVHEVAKDLEIPNKDVIDVLKDYTGETKKHMTALTEDELDLVFESFTQKNNRESLDDYFAEGTKQEEPLVTVEQETTPAAQAQPEQAKQPAPKAVKAPQAETARPQKNAGAKPAQPAQQNQQNGQPQRKAVKPGKITLCARGRRRSKASKRSRTSSGAPRPRPRERPKAMPPRAATRATPGAARAGW